MQHSDRQISIPDSERSTKSNKIVPLTPRSANEPLNPKELGRIEKWFAGPYFNFVSYCKFPIVLIGLVIAAYAGYRSTFIEGLKSMEQYFKDGHYLSDAFLKHRDDFNEGEQAQTIVVDVMFGVTAIDRTGTDFFNAS